MKNWLLLDGNKKTVLTNRLKKGIGKYEKVSEYWADIK